MDSLDVYGNYMHWWGEARSEDRIKPQKYLYDTETQTDYVYDDNLILMSSKGIVWVDFKIKDKDIPKGEIFNNKYSIIKYYPF